MSKSANNEHYFIDMINKGYFEIRDTGEIWRLMTKRWKNKDEKIQPRMVGSKNHDKGYLQVFIAVNGKQVACLVHRIIWIYFNGDIPRGLVMNHINGIKTDNRLDNLELVTCSENNKHAFRIGLVSITGENNPRSKLTDKDIKNIRSRALNKELHRNIAKDYGVTAKYVHRIVGREFWTHI